MRSSSCNTAQFQYVRRIGDPYGTRTRIVGLRGRCPDRLDEGTMERQFAAGDPHRIRTGVAALKELCPDHLDERTRSGMGLPGSGDRGHQNIINADMKQCRKNDQVVDGG